MINLNQFKFSWLLKKSMSVIALRVLGMAIVYVAILFISNSYGAETYGRYSLAQTSLQFLILFFTLGLRSSIVKLTADNNFFHNKLPLNNYLKKSLYLLLISSVICSVTLYLIKDWIALKVFNDFNLKEYFFNISLLVPFALFHAVLAEFVRAKRKFWEYGFFVYVLPPILFVALLLASKKANLAESTTILNYLISISLVCIILFFYVPFKNINPKRGNFRYKSLISLSFPMMFTALFLFITNWTDIFMLGALATKKDVGIYSAAFKLGTIAVVVINAINTVFAPRISELFSENRIKDLILEFQKARKTIVLLTLPVIIFLLVFGGDLLLLFGPEFIYGKTALLIIVSSLFITALTGSVDLFLNMTKHQKQLGYFTFISACLNVVLNYILIKKMGINGAAIASFISNITLNLLCIFYIKRKFGFYTFKK